MRVTTTVIALTVLSGCSNGCGNGGRPDVGVEQDVEVPGPDSNPMNSEGGVGPDTSVGPDAGDAGTNPTPDARPEAGGDGSVLLQSCRPVGGTIELFREVGMDTRAVYMDRFSTGFVAVAAYRVEGLYNAFLHRISDEGMLTNAVNVSALRGASVTFATLNRDGDNIQVGYTSNQVSGDEVYLRAVDTAGIPMGVPVRVSNDMVLSEEIRAFHFSGSWLALWRLRDRSNGTSRLMASRVSGGMASAPIAVTPMDVAVGAYDAVAVGNRVAVAYVSASGVASTLKLQFLNSMGMADGVALDISEPPSVSGNPAVAARGNEVAVTWVQSIANVYLHTRTVNAESRVLSPRVDYGGLGANITNPGIVTDPQGGYSMVFRSPFPSGPGIGMLRIGNDLQPRAAVNFVAASSAGIAVRVAAKGDGLFAIGWVDVSPSESIGKVQVMRCE